MLKSAKECAILKDKFKIKVLIPENIIGLKVQAGVNDPKREAREWADIEELLKILKGQLDLALLREYLSLFRLEERLDHLLEKVSHA